MEAIDRAVAETAVEIRVRAIVTGDIVATLDMT
ncbi:unnamed protein product, partial [Tilletia controversa]